MVWGKEGRGRVADEAKGGGRWMGGLGPGEVQGGAGRHLQGREFWADVPAGSTETSCGEQSEEECFHQIAAALLL